jgi:hypothetical protein
MALLRDTRLARPTQVLVDPVSPAGEKDGDAGDAE